MSPDPGGERAGWTRSGVRRFGSYHLIGKLATGGMADIFLAKQIGAEGFERNVVIKRMLEHLTKIPEFVTMFLDEARLAAKLTHPNIVQITDLGVAEDFNYICMEYLPGEDLQRIIRRCRQSSVRIPMGLAGRIMLSACEGLEFAHDFEESGKRLNIVHRDVTPSNILVTYQGTVKVVDFGIAKAETKAAATAAGKLKGKVSFMSPEQVRGDDIDHRSDIFSLGLTMYELLTGKRVFERDTELGILKAVLESNIPSPRQLAPDIPLALEAVVMKALQRDLDKRYPSAGAMRSDLDAFLRRHDTPSGTREMAKFMEELFGRQQMEQKTRIPTLKELTGDVAVPGLTGTHPGDKAGDLTSSPTTPDIPVEMLRAVAAARKAEGVPTVVTPRTAGWRRAVVPVVSVVMGAGLATGIALWPKPAPPPLPAVAPVAPISAPAAQPSVVAPQPSPTGAPPPSPTAIAARPRPRPSVASGPPAQLSPRDVASVVANSRAKILGCFERHRAVLSSNEGQVLLTLTVVQSGDVRSAEVSSGGDASTGLSSCIVQQVKALRFPRHIDKEVTINVPFVYRISE